jgi:hypothetical protein
MSWRTCSSPTTSDKTTRGTCSIFASKIDSAFFLPFFIPCRWSHAFTGRQLHSVRDMGLKDECVPLTFSAAAAPPPPGPAPPPA